MAKQELVTTWEKWTGLTEYTKDYHITKKRKKLFLEFLKTQPKGARVLDIGCYVGDVVNEFHSLGFDAYGVDIVAESIAQAKKNYPYSTFKVADLNEGVLPFEDGFFDVIWAGDIIEHIYNTINLFSQFNRVLKKGGYLVCSTPYHGKLKLIAVALVDAKRHFHPEHPHVRYYTDKSLRAILEKYGFDVESEKYLGRVPMLSNNMFFVSKKARELDWSKVPKTFH
ncbi:class I SAM-dependent methyltransferase [Candidatus Woesearchaeota archaeon]|nr:class I SAM-dependent methyltransferase [Candidatus Woesearchaeota archaeon]